MKQTIGSIQGSFACSVNTDDISGRLKDEAFVEQGRDCLTLMKFVYLLTL